MSYLADAPAAPSGTMPPPRLRMLGCEVDAIDMDEAVARIDAAIAERRFLRHADLNGAIVVAMRDDEKMRESIAGAGLVVADGQSVVWAARLLGQPLPARVPGIDLMHRTIELAERRGYSIYILGARQDVLETAVARLLEGHPALRIAGCHDGYFEDSEELGVAEEIRRSGADILYVAISSPRKEYFLARHGRSLGVPYVMGVGGAIDVVAGVTRRAPGWLQRLGLEWAFRLAQEPRRLFRRYLVTNARFVALSVREVVSRRGRSG